MCTFLFITYFLLPIITLNKVMLSVSLNRRKEKEENSHYKNVS